jgi:hypothetical protein
MEDDNLDFKEQAIPIIEKVSSQLKREDLENIMLTSNYIQIFLFQI